MRVSSAYWIIGKSLSAERGIGSPNIPCSFAALRRDWRVSTDRTKSRGESESPCLTPLRQWKNFPGTPFNKTAKVPEPKMSFMCSHFCGNPLNSITLIMNSCSILSKAFSKSNFKMIRSLLEWWHMCTYSRAQATQSWIVLLLINPYWFLWISEGKKTYNLLATILVIILTEQMSSEIGL